MLFAGMSVHLSAQEFYSEIKGLTIALNQSSGLVVRYIHENN